HPAELHVAFRRMYCNSPVIKRLEIGFSYPEELIDPLDLEDPLQILTATLHSPTRLRGSSTSTTLGLFPELFAHELLKSTTRAAARAAQVNPPPWWIQAADPLALLEIPGAGLTATYKWQPLHGRRFSIWELRGNEQQHLDAARRLRILLSHLHSELMGLDIILPLLQSGTLTTKSGEVRDYLDHTCSQLASKESFGYSQRPYIAKAVSAFGDHHRDTVDALKGVSATIKSKGLKRKVADLASVLSDLPSPASINGRVTIIAPTVGGEMIERTPKKMESHNKPETGTSIFLVHGRDTKSATEMRNLLRAFGLSIIDWEDAKASLRKGSPYIGDIVREGVRTAHAIVVLFTPDEEVQLHASLGGGENGLQSRPNVYYEAGIADALDPDHLILVELGDVRPFSDAAGRHAVRFDGSEGSRNRLRNALMAVGLKINDKGGDWLHVGTFTNAPK
ncbi:TIR domain-containing protein, partial [Streptomyces goshikiensis]